MPADHFDERVAASYDAVSAAMFDPAVVDPAVDLLVERWGGWRREAFTGDSRSHVSIWQKPE